VPENPQLIEMARDAEVARLQTEVKEIGELLQKGIDKINFPCCEALDWLWERMMPKGYGGWEYPAQAGRHLLAEFEEMRDLAEAGLAVAQAPYPLHDHITAEQWELLCRGFVKRREERADG